MQHIFTGAGAPTIVPTGLGHHYIDTVSNSSYISIGTSSSADWSLTGSTFAGDVTGPASAVDSQVAIFNGTTGKIIKAATGTGVAELASGVLSATATTGTGNVVKAASPALTGTPTAPTATQGNNSTQVATTAYVDTGLGTKSPTLNDTGLGETVIASAGTGQVKKLISGTNITLTPAADSITVSATAGGTGDVVGPASAVDSQITLFDGTTGKLVKAASITGIAQVTSGVLSAASTTGTGAIVLAAAPALTGIPTAPTATQGDNSTQIATTAYVDAGLATKEPTITAGTTAQYYRGDKTFQTLDKAAVGLGNVDNTSDATKNSAVATLTNKTIDADLNTITNIENADIKSGAAIAVNKLAALTVSRAVVTDGSGFVSAAATTSTEIGYVNGVTSAIQTQLDGKVTGPASATDENIAVFDGTTGKLVKSTGSKPISSLDKKVITFVVDGGGTAVTAGLKSFVRVPQACTITKWTLMADVSGSIVVDIWKDTFANFPPTVADTITGSAKPTLSAAQSGDSTTLTGWTTSIAAGDVLAFNVDSATTVTRVTLEIEVTNT